MSSILSKFKKDNPTKTITAVGDYNNKLYLISAVENANEPNFNSPIYYIEKSNGSWGGFNPMLDLKGFDKAFTKNSVDVNSI